MRGGIAIFFCGVSLSTGATTLRWHPFIVGFCPIGVLFCDQKSTRKVPLLPGRGARLKGAWVRAAHERFASAPLRIQERTHWPLPGANTLRLNGSQFLLFIANFGSFVGGGVLDAPCNFALSSNPPGEHCSPLRSLAHRLCREGSCHYYTPSRKSYGRISYPPGRPHTRRHANPKAPLCKGGWLRVSADWGIVTLPIHRTTLARSQSLRPCGAPPFTQGRLYAPLPIGPVARGLAPSQAPCPYYTPSRNS